MKPSPQMHAPLESGMADRPLLTAEQYERNFAEVAPAMTRMQATAEAARCLYCYDAPCTKACPTRIDVASFIRKIAQDNLTGAARVILEANVLGASCARVCPTEVLCEGACVCVQQHQRPIAIGRLQRYAMDQGGPRAAARFTAAAPIGRSVAIVGGGPAGLSCAWTLTRAGVAATIFEARAQAGGLNRFGVAEYKLPQAVADQEIALVRQLGVEIRTGVRVGRDVAWRELLSGHDAVFLACGLGRTRSLGIPGEDLTGVLDALDFIEAVKTRRFADVPIGRRVAVIGGGNTAIDAATQARRLGAEEVTIVYRRSEAELPCYRFEYERAKADGAQFRWRTAPQRILGDDRVRALECVEMRATLPGTDGRPRPEAIPGSEFEFPTDLVLKALGQASHADLLAGMPDVEVRNGRVVVDAATGRTGHPRVFAGGDCTSGGREVVDAVADGTRAALAMLKLWQAG